MSLENPCRFIKKLNRRYRCPVYAAIKHHSDYPCLQDIPDVHGQLCFVDIENGQYSIDWLTCGCDINHPDFPGPAILRRYCERLQPFLVADTFSGSRMTGTPTTALSGAVVFSQGTLLRYQQL
ncbi:MAG: hypothetical protein WDX04_16605, partial [Klebsiella michiganensis]